MNYLNLDKEATREVAEELNQLLCNYHIYYQNLRNFHWNVNGVNFFDLHDKFEALYNDARTKIDEIAERILTLRHKPLSRFSTYLKRAEITESPILQDDYEMVNVTLFNHQTIISNFRRILKVAGEAQDEGTLDLIGSFLAELEKESWMLDAWRVRQEAMVS
jgi:starvation-inducible DNA-binding protein